MNKLAGKIVKIVFKQTDTGFAVIHINQGVENHTAVGTIPEADLGLEVELTGDWKDHAKFGTQFVFSEYHVPTPTGQSGIVAYLSTLNGIKESLANRIYEHFGEETIEIIENNPDRLLEVRGIGVKSLPKILESYEETKGMRRLISFLHQIGVSVSAAARIYEDYDEDSTAAITAIKANPYILEEKVRGFGFKRADEVALKVGIAPDSLFRHQAAIASCLKSAASMQGHCYLPIQRLKSDTCELLSLPSYRPTGDDLNPAISDMKEANHSRKLYIEEDKVYLYYYYQKEEELAEKLQGLSGKFRTFVDMTEWLVEYDKLNKFPLGREQKIAVQTAANYQLVVLTGGAGVGKSTVSKAVIQMWLCQRKRVVACAPTGKAAQRLKEITGIESSTIHRLLGWNGWEFEYNENNCYPADAFLIDESSMIDLSLAHALFQAIPPFASVMLVGDINQLPSVGAGNVLRDLIKSGIVPVVKLTEIFRQAGTSQIITASHAVNEGNFPVLTKISSLNPESWKGEAVWAECETNEIPNAIKWLVGNYLLNFYTPSQIQILSPMNRGNVGNYELSKLIQSVWNPLTPDDKEVKGFRVGDRVIQTCNDYKAKVFNGDIGLVIAINMEEKTLVAHFQSLEEPEGRWIEYGFGELDALKLAYSISIHKSQGSEFDVVIIPWCMAHWMMLYRNVLYTGITRAKKLMILVGQKAAISKAVAQQNIDRRYTQLRDRLLTL